MNNEIKSLKDLYRLLLPALRSKKKEMHELKHLYTTEEDIWNYMKDNTWQNATNLTLSDMADDILNTENDEIAAFLARRILESRIDSDEEV
ncbi:MAG: hypothetical protein E7158_03775 [Firmicutes bacterium]|nr:hypothetical protein [Bacillota bacterium]